MKFVKQVDTYIHDLPEEERLIAERIREMIFDLVPQAEERFSFRLPFYHYFGMFCYINRLKKGGIELAFCRGKDLILAFPELELKNRAMIAGITINSLGGMDLGFLRSLISSAAVWQQEAHVSGKPFVKKKKS